jgi:hypothetical protein
MKALQPCKLRPSWVTTLAHRFLHMAAHHAERDPAFDSQMRAVLRSAEKKHSRNPVS